MLSTFQGNKVYFTITIILALMAIPVLSAREEHYNCYDYFSPEFPYRDFILLSDDSLYRAQYLPAQGGTRLLIVLNRLTNEISKFPDANIMGFDWLKDSHKIVLAVDTEYSDVPGIYLWDIDKNKIKQLVKPENKRKGSKSFLDSFMFSRLSFDHKKVYYFYSYDYNTIPDDYPTVDDLYVVDIDGGNNHKCVVSYVSLQPECYNYFDSDYSRRDLVLHSSDFVYEGQYIGTWCEARILIVLNFKTNKIIQFPDTGVRGFAWLENTHKIVLAIDSPGDKPGIYLWDVEENTVKQLVEPTFNEEIHKAFAESFVLSAISEDQKKIYYLYHNDYDTMPDDWPSIDYLYVVDIDGSNPMKCIDK